MWSWRWLWSSSARSRSRRPPVKRAGEPEDPPTQPSDGRHGFVACHSYLWDSNMKGEAGSGLRRTAFSGGLEDRTGKSTGRTCGRCRDSGPLTDRRPSRTSDPTASTCLRACSTSAGRSSFSESHTSGRDPRSSSREPKRPDPQPRGHLRDDGNAGAAQRDGGVVVELHRLRQLDARDRLPLRPLSLQHLDAPASGACVPCVPRRSDSPHRARADNPAHPTARRRAPRTRCCASGTGSRPIGAS